MKKLITFLALISLTIFFIFSCQKDKPATYPGGNSSYTSIRTTVSGMVLDESNAPLTGVIVTAYGQTTTTTQYGTFVLKNINANKNRCVLQFTKAGFFKRAHGFIASANTVNYVRIILLSNVATQNFSASSGGTVSLADGSSAQFQPNSIVTTNGSAYTGTVNLIVKHLSPDAVNFGFTIPGGDLLGKDLNDKDVALYTYGMLGVELTGSSGEALQLAAGTSATLTMSIAASQLSSAPASIPLWYFDETTSLWKEEGAANKVGNNYVGTVGHFSWWNWDIGADSPIIKGKVVDCNGTPVPNIVVTVNGWATTITNQYGAWQGQVPAGLPLTAQVLSSNNGGVILNSQLENIPPLSNNQTFSVPDLIIPCPTRVAGSIKTCTGEVTDGFVFISNLSYSNFQYTSNGAFNIIAPENAQMNLYAMNTSYHHSQNIITLTAPNILTIQNILLCDTGAINSENWLKITNCSLINDTLVNMDSILTSFGIVDTNNGCDVSILFNNGVGNFHLYVSGATSGNYSWKITTMDPYINCVLNSVMNLNTDPPHSGTINITIGNVGSYIEGTFNGTAEFHKNSPSDVANIQGHFKVLRTQ